MWDYTYVHQRGFMAGLSTVGFLCGYKFRICTQILVPYMSV